VPELELKGEGLTYMGRLHGVCYLLDKLLSIADEVSEQRSGALANPNNIPSSLPHRLDDLARTYLKHAGGRIVPGAMLVPMREHIEHKRQERRAAAAAAAQAGGEAEAGGGGSGAADVDSELA
jgi:hypothetical protein